MPRQRTVQTPWDLGYRMPAEWEPHEATWLAWPKDPITFPGRAIDLVEDNFTDVIRALQEGEKVRVLVDNQKHEEKVRDKLHDNGVKRRNVEFHHIPSVDVWIRDYGPTFLKDRRGEVTTVKWNFNAWGGKYPDLLPDERTGLRVAKAAGVSIFRPGIVMEGGAIDSNGQGILLTTEQCMLNPNRNPHLGRYAIDKCLREFTGSDKVIWLGKGILGDDTDGHVDDVARFVSPNTVLCSYQEESDGNHFPLKHNYRLLQKARDVRGERFEVVKFPMPPAMVFQGRELGGEVLPASYANFYIGNRAVIVPVFGRESDNAAISILREQFKGRNIVPVYSTAWVYGAGAVHCATQQQPARGRTK